MDVAMIYKSACDTKIDARFTPNAIRVGVQFAADKRGSCSHPGSRVSEPASLFVYPGLVFTIRLLPLPSPDQRRDPVASSRYRLRHDQHRHSETIFLRRHVSNHSPLPRTFVTNLTNPPCKLRAESSLVILTRRSNKGITLVSLG